MRDASSTTPPCGSSPAREGIGPPTLRRPRASRTTGLTKFVISPKDSVGGNDLSLTGIGEPPLLVNATDVFQMENEFIELVPEYCSHRLQLKEGGKIFSDASLSLNTFYDCMKERKAYEFYKFGKVRRLGDKGDKPQ
jgi:hypothetical protein